MSTDPELPGRGLPGAILAAAEGRLREVAPMPILELAGIGKTYRDAMTLRPFTAVDNVTLTLERGEVFGLLGPNGAGKTTTLKMILGLARPTSGTVRLEGRDPRDPAARRRLGYLPENPCFYDHLTALEFLGLVGDLFGIEPGARRRRSEALLARLGLSAHTGKPLRKFSKGMTQRLGLAQALLNQPTFLVLDEPMSGLDPIGRAEVKQILRDERERGATILLTSHVLAEVESVCDRVGILRSGRLIEVGSVPALLASGVREWEIAADALGQERIALLRSWGHRVDGIGARAIVRVETADGLQDVLRELTQAGIRVHSVEQRRETLEEHFVRALSAGREARS